MTRDELAALPTLLDVEAAARVLGVGRSLAYELVREGKWPTPVLRVGRLIRIPSAPLVRLIDGGADARTATAGEPSPIASN